MPSITWRHEKCRRKLPQQWDDDCVAICDPRSPIWDPSHDRTDPIRSDSTRSMAFCQMQPVWRGESGFGIEHKLSWQAPELQDARCGGLSLALCHVGWLSVCVPALVLVPQHSILPGYILVIRVQGYIGTCGFKFSLILELRLSKIALLAV